MSGLVVFDGRTANELIEMVREGRRRPADRSRPTTMTARHTNSGLLFRTGEDGIPAGDGVVAGKALCTCVFIDSNDEIVEMLGPNDGPLQREVWNVSTEDVAGDTVVLARIVGVKPVVDMGGTEGWLLKTTEEIPTRSGNTLGTGSAIVCHRSGTTIVETTETITAYNASKGEAIPAGAYKQAKLWQGVPLIDVVDCDTEDE